MFFSDWEQKSKDAKRVIGKDKKQLFSESNTIVFETKYLSI